MRNQLGEKTHNQVKGHGAVVPRPADANGNKTKFYKLNKC
jgi:hypothetical protein